jgi:hypothetical protein
MHDVPRARRLADGHVGEREPSWIITARGGPEEPRRGAVEAPGAAAGGDGAAGGGAPVLIAPFGPSYTIRFAETAELSAADHRRLSALSREVVCLRASYASAGLLRRWWAGKRLLAAEREKAVLEWRALRRRG